MCDGESGKVFIVKLHMHPVGLEPRPYTSFHY